MLFNFKPFKKISFKVYQSSLTQNWQLSLVTDLENVTQNEIFKKFMFLRIFGIFSSKHLGTPRKTKRLNLEFSPLSLAVGVSSPWSTTDDGGRHGPRWGPPENTHQRSVGSPLLNRESRWQPLRPSMDLYLNHPLQAVLLLLNSRIVSWLLQPE